MFRNWFRKHSGTGVPASTITVQKPGRSGVTSASGANTANDYVDDFGLDVVAPLPHGAFLPAGSRNAAAREAQKSGLPGSLEAVINAARTVN